ncbi:hypothetical protein CWI36_0576p0020 [Hamiltosporidium magnivora]|uniref:Uncharacterized protein n=1 Tax=Hamiltosporidium magnivora TaxID=148818 RepID=A0A4Q9LCY5_9MICR|nr:hypothetical protein CWI36_0576p0020 [Hamiltosporidium magnivora]
MSFILLLRNHIFGLNVKILDIKEIKDNNPFFYTGNKYFLDMKTCSMVKNYNPAYFLIPLTPKNSNKGFSISYPKDILLSFEFFDELILNNQEEVTIYMNNVDIPVFSYFLKLSKIEDFSILKMKSKYFFEILKYLNIFNIVRNKSYKQFSKTLVYYSIICNLGFDKEASELILNPNCYNNLHVLDIIECIFVFYLFKTSLIFKIFHDYESFEFSSSIFRHKEYKMSRNTLFMDYKHLYSSKYIFNKGFSSVWKIMIKIFFIDKLYLDLYSSESDIYSRHFISSIPYNFKNIVIEFLEKEISLLDKIYERGFLHLAKKVKIIVMVCSKDFIKRIHYFEKAQKLVLEFLDINLDEILNIERSIELKSIKIIKINISTLICVQRIVPAFSLSGQNNNLSIDLSEEMLICDSRNFLNIFSTYNFKNYLTGIDLRLHHRSFDRIYFEKILNFKLIKRLKMDLENVKGNRLKSYKFLELFQFLNKLTLKNIKLTNKLFKIIIRSKCLVSVVFEGFRVTNRNKNFKNFNESIIQMKFYDPNTCLSVHLFTFLSKFRRLKHFFFTLYSIQENNDRIYSIYDKISNLKVVRPKDFLNLPKLELLKYENDFDSMHTAPFSSLNIFSNCFDLENIVGLMYSTACLFKEDIDIFSNFKALKNLELNIHKNQLNLKFFQKILQTNIKNTIVKFVILTDTYQQTELISILCFKKLKMLELGISSEDIRNIRKLDLLFGMKLVKIHIYALKKRCFFGQDIFARETIFSNI